MPSALGEILNQIVTQDPRYKQDAYLFVMEALSYTQRKFERLQHVAGEELLEGIKELLLEKFGPMTITVLKHWGIHSTDDFGCIVFNLVEHRVLSKTLEDNIEAFKNRYDFHDVFDKGYRQSLAQKLSRMLDY